jgi:NAD(P)-dependent dehydrogenase (short-subunit alcohol dehydrogenase family)
MIKAAPEEVRKKALEEIVLGKIGKPKEVVHVVTFFCSEMASYIGWLSLLVPK